MVNNLSVKAMPISLLLHCTVQPEFRYIETERMRLRQLTPLEYNFIFANYNEDELWKFFAFRTEEEFELEKKKHGDSLQSYGKTFLYFHMLDKASGDIIGTIGYHTWYTRHDRAELFYHIKSELLMGKGYASEALKEVLRHGFKEMGLNRVEAFIGPLNIPSQRLVQKAGFTREGLMRGHYFVNGKHQDSLVYGLLKDEYERQSSGPASNQ